MAWRRLTSIGGFIADSEGSDFRCTIGQAGWEDGAPVRAEIAEKAQQDGGWDATPYFGPRVITHVGEVDQGSRADALAVQDELLALRPATLHEYMVDDPYLGVRSATVRVTQSAVVEWVSPVRFRYTIGLTAPDPFKYGPPTFAQATLAGTVAGAGMTFPLAFPLDFGVPAGVTPGALSLSNAGTASYFPRLRIDGPVLNPVVTLTETGDQIRYSGSVLAGQWLDIDPARRRVLLNGLVSQRHLVTFTGNWLAVPVGGGSLSWTADTADPSATLSCWAFEGVYS